MIRYNDIVLYVYQGGPLIKTWDITRYEKGHEKKDLTGRVPEATLYD